MNKNITLEPTADEAAEIQEAIQRLLAEIKHANEQMTKDQQEIDQMRAETRAILARLGAG